MVCPGRPRAQLGLWLMAIPILSLASTPAHGQDSAAAAIRQRIEKLEQSNEVLRQQLETGESRVNLEQGDISAQQVQKIVGDYLKEVDKKKKSDDDAKKKQAAEEGVEVGKETTMTAKFNNGLHFSTSDGAFKAALRGRWQSDWGWASGDPVLTTRFGEPLDDGVNFRRSRIGLQGTIWELFDFIAEADFATSPVNFRQIWMGVRELPYVGNFRAGHMKEPFSLEQLNSTNYLTFIERAPVTESDAMAEGYSVGMEISRGWLDDRVTGATGVFVRAPDGAPVTVASDQCYNWCSRVTCLPLWQENGRYMVHLGAAYAIGTDPINDNPWARSSTRRFRSRPYRIDAVDFIDTGNLIYNDRESIGTEFATVIGPLSIQAEYIWNNLNNVANSATNGAAPSIGDIGFQGWYAYVSYFLTGENRVFSRSPNGGPHNPSFGRPFVYEPFFLVRRGENGCGRLCCGKGAWEVAARYSWLDYNDGAIAGGELGIVTLGLNWYWNSNMKVQWNYEHLMVKDRPISGGAINPIVPLFDGDADTLVMRFHWDF